MMMKHLIVWSMLLIASGVWGQKDEKWVSIDQSYYGMKYKLPQSWEVDGFGSSDWDDYGSSVCRCAGTINIGDRYGEKTLYMVAYPSLDLKSIREGKRSQVWDWKYDDPGTQGTMKKYGKTRWYLTRSSWTKESTKEEDGDLVVWRYITTYKKQYYVVYFWAKEDVMLEKSGEIDQILSGMKLIRRKK
ncbi:MAG: hypothetical protein EP338_08170 [Bacteroidetes bacterium]|nr:MAG: hypothetical protein EP338_08170 [Bacteroidota bacterium]